ncbi:AbiTii domain-containing protein [Catenibacterium mitsuokai]|uniref:AbiTii domain-containing protein n=1 Tax=Catenibacterium mitsuokai TaxID=100886 RepID=UPI003F89BCDA
MQYELNGYTNKKSYPEYRKVRETLKYLTQYYGWYPITISNNEIEKINCERKISNAISLGKTRNQKESCDN